MILHLCADAHCKQKNSCFRYVVDPETELRVNHRVMIDPTLRVHGEQECSKYCSIKLVDIKK